VQATESGVRLSLVATYLNFRLAEDYYFQVTILRDEFLYVVIFLFEALAENYVMADRVRNLSCVLANHINHQWTLHVLLSDILNVLRDCRREDHCLCFGHVALDLHDVSVESHVEHFITFVEDLELRGTDIEAMIF